MKIIRLTILILVIATTLVAQSNNRIGRIAKFGGAGGFSPIILFPNYDDVNISLTKLGMNKLSGPIYALGGSGYAYVMIIDNLRLGGIGFSGFQSESSLIKSKQTEVTYSLGGGAGTIEYTLPSIKNMALSVGFMIGGGSLDINIYQNSENYTWDNIWGEVENNTSSNDKELSISNSFFFLSPTINLDLPVTRFLAIRGGLGYQFTFNSEWEIANNKKLSNVPSGLNGNGLFIQTGLFIGLFAF